MNKQDKALLQNALMAYLEIVGEEEAKREARDNATNPNGWNPIENDADALRLAVVARLFRGYGHVLHEHLDKLGQNSPENTRRAIVMAACQVHTPKAYRDQSG